MSFGYQDRKNLWIAAGGPSWAADIAAAISMAENREGDPMVISPAQDVGLWQINIPYHPQYTVEQMQNPMENARAAIAISNGGTNWNPWVTYKSGAYLPFLQSGAPAGSMEAATGGNCATTSIQLPSLPGFPSDSLCMDGPLGICAVAAGLFLGLTGLLIMAIFALKDTGAGRELTKTARMIPAVRAFAK